MYFNPGSRVPFKQIMQPTKLQQAAKVDPLKADLASGKKSVSDIFGQAKEAVSQQAGATQIEADRRMQEDLARNSNASGGFGGAEQTMRTNAMRDNAEQTGMAKAGILAQLGAQEGQAQMQEEQFIKSYGLQKDQLDTAKQQWKLEFDENKKTNMLMAVLNMKKTGMGAEAYAQYYNTYSGFYPDAPAPTFNPGGNFSQDVYNRG